MRAGRYNNAAIAPTTHIPRSVKPNAPLPARRSELHIEFLNLFRLGTRPFDPLDHQRPVHDVIAVGCAFSGSATP